MELKQLFTELNPNLIIFLLTTFFAFISWLAKGIIEKPINQSKETFNKYLDKRIHVLTEVKSRLNFIAYFPGIEESKEFKEQMQNLLLNPEKACYINKDTFDSVLKISIEPETNEKLLLDSITNIDKDLYSQISKIQDEIRFYRKFSNFNPVKKSFGFTFLILQYFLSLVLILCILYSIVYIAVVYSVTAAILLVLIFILAFYIVNRYVF